MNIPNHRSQSGVIAFKSILIIFGIGFTLLMVLIVATAGPAKEDEGPQSAEQTGAQAADTKETEKTAPKAAVKLPEGFKRFTNKQYGFSVAYPEAWGSLIVSPTTINSLLRAETKPAVYPLGGAQISGSLSVSVYPSKDFRIATRLGNPFLIPFKKDGKTTWQVVSVDQKETKLKVGDTYKITSSTNPSGLTTHDFTWLFNGQRQARWVFESGDNYIILLIPALGRPDGTEPTGNDLLIYTAFAESIVETVSLPR